MAETLHTFKDQTPGASPEGYELRQYANNNGKHMYEVDAEGNASRTSHDKIIADFGYDPTPSNYARSAEVGTPENTKPPTVAGEGSEATNKAGEDLTSETDELVDRLDKILPGKKEKKPKSIEEKFDELKRDMDRRYEELERKMERMLDQDTAVTEVKIREHKPDDGKSSRDKDKDAARNGDARKHDKDNGDKSKHDINGYPVSEDVIQGIENGELIGNNGKLNGKHETPGEGVDVAAMEASMDRLDAIQKELENATPERAAELNKEMAEELAKMREVWKGGEDTDEEPVSTEQAKDMANQRKKNIFRRAWDRIRGSVYGASAAAAAGGAGGSEAGAGNSGESGGDSAGSDVSETNKKEKERRRGALGLVAGALAVGGGAALAYFLMRQGHPTEVINQFCGGHHAGGYDHNHMPIHHAHGGHNPTHEAHHAHGTGHEVEGVEVPKGDHLEHLVRHNGNWHDTIWNHVAKETNNQNVHAHVQRVLELNSKAIMRYAQPDENVWQAAHHLPEEFKFVMPNHF